MTTKDNCWLFNDKQETFVGFSANVQYNNLNLNHNKQLLPNKTLSSKRVVPNDSRKDLSDTNGLQKRKDSLSRWKFKPDLSSYYAEEFEKQKDFYQKKIGCQESVLNKNSSTLSFHITAYENSVEIAAASKNGNNNDAAKKNNGTIELIGKSKDATKYLYNSDIKTPFELPRQQKGNKSKPEVMQFKASQQLLNPDQPPPPEAIVQSPSRGIEAFCYRRSSRKTAATLQKERDKDILWRIGHPTENESDLLVEEFPGKGRGVRATKNYNKNDFVCEYKGEVISMKEAHERENRYARDASIGSYMYFFVWKNRHYCVDATSDSGYKGRLINHSYLNPNLRTQVVEDVKGNPHLCLFALRSIKPHEELLYDYGDHSAESVAGNPWILNS